MILFVHYRSQRITTSSAEEVQPTDAQKIDLAKWLTIYGNSGTTDAGRAALSNGTTSNGIPYAELAYQNGISIKWDNGMTSVGDKTYSWENENSLSGSDITGSESKRIDNIKSIENKF